MNLFGKAKAKPNPTETIQTLRSTLETLEKRSEYIQKKIDAQVNLAKQKVAQKDKRAAMFALKRKKLLEAELNKIAGAQMTLEVQVMTLENATNNLQVVRTLQEGATALKNIHGEMRIERVDQIMDDINAEMQNAQDITDAIAQPVGAAGLLDDDELLSELNEMEEQMVSTQLLDADISVPSTTRKVEMPAAPVGIRQPAAQAETEAEREERELRELEASF